MAYKLRLIVLVVIIEAAILLILYKSSEIAEKTTIQPLNEIKNLHDFLENTFESSVLEFNLNVITKPGDNAISKIRGLQVKFKKSNYSNEVIE